MTNNEIQYKAFRFRMEADKTTFAYEVKRVRALWDPGLSIPGTGRRGGWRCPVGTRYGGQITDRFGRNCGWGVARRIANAITNVGDRLENVDDRRRGRRVSKRNRRMVGRLQRNAEAGRAERGLRNVAERLDGETAETLTPPRTPSVDAPDIDAPESETPKPRTRRVRNQRKPRGQLGRGWRGVLDPNGRRYWERDDRGWRDGSDGFIDVPEGGDIPEGGAPATPDADTPTPTRPGAGRRRREREVVADDDLDGRRRPSRRETLEDIFFGPDYNPPKRDGRELGEIVFVDGKPYKWQANPNARLIGAGPQRKGDWVPASATDLENDRVYKKRLKNLQGEKPKGAPDPEGKRFIWNDDEGDQWEYNPLDDRWSLQGNVKKRREAEKKDEEDRKKDDERRRKRNEERQREQQGEAQDATDQPPRRPPLDSDDRDAGLRESERRRVRREIDEPGAPRTEEGDTPQAEEQPKPRKPRKRRVQASDQRAQESATRKPAGDNAPAGTQKKPTERIDLTEEMVELDLAPGESAPDERSFRNVNNRFPKNGLPDNAYWRDAKYDGNDKAELERRFGRYFGGDNNINNRGKVVNQELKRRRDAGEIKPARRRKKPDAQKEPQKPVSDVDLPPFMPGTQLDDEVRKVQKALDDAKKIAAAINREEKDFVNIPERPSWRDTQNNRLGDDDRAKLEAALGQFYNNEGNLNERGRQIFNQIAEIKKNDSPKPPTPSTPNVSPIVKANSADELVAEIGANWRRLDEQEMAVVAREYGAAGGLNALAKNRDDGDIERIKNNADADQYINLQQANINEGGKQIEKLLKQLKDARTTRGGEMDSRRKRENLEAIARVSRDIRRRRDLIARAEAKRQGGFAVDAPEAAVLNLPNDNEGIAELNAGNAIGANVFSDGGLFSPALGRPLTKEEFNENVLKRRKDKKDSYLRMVEDEIRDLAPEELRERRNTVDKAVDAWRDGYDAARTLLEAELEKHKGKKLDALPREDQERLLFLANSVNDNAIEVEALRDMVTRYDDHLREAGMPRERAAPAADDLAGEFDGTGNMIPNEPSPVRRKLEPNKDAYDAAVKAVHEDGALIEEVADEIIIDAMFDEDLKISDGQRNFVLDTDKPLTKENIQKEGLNHFLLQGGKMENRRFNFELIKTYPGGNRSGVWEVMKVTDKKTGETWFLKAAVYGHNGAMLEGIGMRVAEVLQLGNDRAHLRIGAPVKDAITGKEHRWMIMRGIMDWDNPGGVVPRRDWMDVGDMAWNADPRDIAPEDAARIAVLDFVFKNNDRHAGNFMFNVDQNGKVRLGLIDHGLIGMGRGRQGDDDDARRVEPLTPEEWQEEVQKILRRLERQGVRGYQGEPNDGFSGLRGIGFQHQSPEARERFARIVSRSIRVLEKQIQSILSEEELQRAGMKLTAGERAHLDALRTVAVARLEHLKRHQEDLIRVFN